MGVLAYHPELTAAYNNLISHALYFTTITPRQRELLILRVAHRRGSRYEWAQHVYQAGVVGLTAEEVERVRSGAEAEGWDELDSALLRAADELVADARIGDATYAVLSPSARDPPTDGRGLHRRRLRALRHGHAHVRRPARRRSAAIRLTRARQVLRPPLTPTIWPVM